MRFRLRYMMKNIIFCLKSKILGLSTVVSLHLHGKMKKHSSIHINVPLMSGISQKTGLSFCISTVQCQETSLLKGSLWKGKLIKEKRQHSIAAGSIICSARMRNGTKNRSVFFSKIVPAKFIIFFRQKYCISLSPIKLPLFILPPEHFAFTGV